MRNVILAIATIAGLTGCASGEDSKRQTPEEPISWHVVPINPFSSSNCGHTHWEPFKFEMDGNIIRTTAWSGQTWNMKLLEPLNADGSGRVQVYSYLHNRPVTLLFAPGHGPREVDYIPPYSICFWRFLPDGQDPMTTTWSQTKPQ